MVKQEDIASLLQSGTWTTGRPRSLSTSFDVYNTPTWSFRSKQAEDAPNQQDTTRGAPERPARPKAPERSQPRASAAFVEDEDRSLGREFDSSPDTSDAGSVRTPEEPKNRGEVNQVPLLIPVHEHNPERRFVILAVPNSTSDGKGRGGPRGSCESLDPGHRSRTGGHDDATMGRKSVRFEANDHRARDKRAGAKAGTADLPAHSAETAAPKASTPGLAKERGRHDLPLPRLDTEFDYQEPTRRLFGSLTDLHAKQDRLQASRARQPRSRSTARARQEGGNAYRDARGSERDHARSADMGPSTGLGGHRDRKREPSFASAGSSRKSSPDVSKRGLHREHNPKGERTKAGSERREAFLWSVDSALNGVLGLLGVDSPSSRTKDRRDEEPRGEQRKTGSRHTSYSARDRSMAGHESSAQTSLRSSRPPSPSRQPSHRSKLDHEYSRRRSPSRRPSRPSSPSRGRNSRPVEDYGLRSDGNGNAQHRPQPRRPAMAREVRPGYGTSEKPRPPSLDLDGSSHSGTSSPFLSPALERSSLLPELASPRTPRTPRTPTIASPADLYFTYDKPSSRGGIDALNIPSLLFPESPSSQRTMTDRGISRHRASFIRANRSYSRSSMVAPTSSPAVRLPLERHSSGPVKPLSSLHATDIMQSNVWRPSPQNLAADYFSPRPPASLSASPVEPFQADEWQDDTMAPPAECRWKTPALAGDRPSGHAFLTLPHAPGFDICRACYNAAFARSRYARMFIPAPPPAPNQPVMCGFGSSVWYRVAYQLAAQCGSPDLRLMAAVAAVAERTKPCPGPRPAVRTWYGVRDPRDLAGRAVEGFAVCHGCALTVQCLLPGLAGAFVPIDTAAEPVHGGVCALHWAPGRHRFDAYMQALISTADRVLRQRSWGVGGSPGGTRTGRGGGAGGGGETIGQQDLQALVDRLRALSVTEECPRDRVIRGARWRVMDRLPNFTVCEECFEDVVCPLLEEESGQPLKGLAGRSYSNSKGPPPPPPPAMSVGNISSASSSGSNMALRFARGRQIKKAASCQLHTDYMREAFRRAFRRNDLEYLELVTGEHKPMGAERQEQDMLVEYALME